MSVGFIVIDINFQVKLFEAVLPWKHENKELKTRVRSLGEELHKCCTELQNCKDVRVSLSLSLLPVMLPVLDLVSINQIVSF